MLNLSDGNLCADTLIIARALVRRDCASRLEKVETVSDVPTTTERGCHSKVHCTQLQHLLLSLTLDHS